MRPGEIEKRAADPPAGAVKLSGFHRPAGSRRKAAQKLPTTSRKQFAQAAQRLGTTVQASTSRANAALSSLAKYDTKELDDAFKADPACQKLTG